MTIKIYTTGGSIDKGYSTQESAFVVGEPQVSAILRDANLSLTFEVESILRKDSLEITEDDRLMIVAKVRGDPHRHIIVTHGTDTMIDTAQALSDVDGKVIVLTGAMQPAVFRQSDAGFNLGCAIIAVQTLPQGVYIVMNGRVFDPGEVRKNAHVDRFEAM
jgi:L-asparaginase